MALLLTRRAADEENPGSNPRLAREGEIQDQPTIYCLSTFLLFSGFWLFTLSTFLLLLFLPFHVCDVNRLGKQIRAVTWVRLSALCHKGSERVPSLS